MSYQNYPQGSSGKGPLYVVISVLAVLLVGVALVLVLFVTQQSKKEQQRVLIEMKKTVDDLQDQNKDLQEELSKQDASQVSSPAPVKSQNTSSSAGSTSMTGVYYGTIGDDPSAVLTLKDGYGTYSYYQGTVVRNIQVQSHSAGGKVVIFAYDRNNGKYVGRLDGTLTGNRIKGVFTNYKGVKVNFDMKR